MIGDTCQSDIFGAHRVGIEVILTIEGGITEYQMETRRMNLEAYLATLPEIAHSDRGLASYFLRSFILVRQKSAVQAPFCFYNGYLIHCKAV